MNTPKIQLAIKAEAPALWAAITDPTVSPAYYYGFAAHYDLTAGAPYRYTSDGADVITGTVLDVVEGEKLKMTFAGTWAPGVAELPESVVTYDLEPHAMGVPGVTVLTLTHEGLPDTAAARDLENGWVLILSGLKTLLETGAPLVPAPTA